MINIIIAIALIIIIIMFYNNFFDFNIDEFSIPRYFENIRK